MFELRICAIIFASFDKISHLCAATGGSDQLATTVGLEKYFFKKTGKGLQVI